MKIMVIEIKPYQLKNISIKLSHIQKASSMILKKSVALKIVLTIGINFVSSKDNDEEWRDEWRNAFQEW